MGVSSRQSRITWFASSLFLRLSIVALPEKPVGSSGTKLRASLTGLDRVATSTVVALCSRAPVMRRLAARFSVPTSGTGPTVDDDESGKDGGGTSYAHSTVLREC